MSTGFYAPTVGSYHVGSFVNDVYYDILAAGKLTCDVEFHFCTVETQPNQRISLSNWTRVRGGVHLFVSYLAASCVLAGVEDNADRKKEWLELERREGMDGLFGTTKLNLAQLLPSSFSY